LRLTGTTGYRNTIRQFVDILQTFTFCKNDRNGKRTALVRLRNRHHKQTVSGKTDLSSLLISRKPLEKPSPIRLLRARKHPDLPVRFFRLQKKRFPVAQTGRFRATEQGKNGMLEKYNNR
jgi:hypothetical protein